MDTLPNGLQSPVLSDDFEVARAHWQVSPAGELCLGLRLPSEPGNIQASDYGSPRLFSPGQIGTWNFIDTVYDRKLQRVRHYANGRQVSSETIVFDQPIKFGTAEIGNWGVSLKPESPIQVISHFIRRIVN